MIVEGVRPKERLSPARAQLVASLLQDLMRCCDEEITARIDLRESITIEANGRVYHDYVPGGALPIVPASFGEPTPRELQIWKAELEKVVLRRDIVSWCIINPLEGAELTENDARMKALEAYILSKRAGVALAAGKH